MLNMAGLSNILIGIVLVLLISASVSTLSSITLTACSTVAMDLLKGKIKPKMSDSHVAMFTRILCLIFVIGSYVVANYPTPILEMMSYSWGIISAHSWRRMPSPCIGRALTARAHGQACWAVS